MTLLIILALSISVSRVVLGIMRRKQRRDEPTTEPIRPLICPRCRYDLHGVDSAQCPECGTVLPRERSAALSAEQEKRMVAARAKVAEAYEKRRKTGSF